MRQRPDLETLGEPQFTLGKGWKSHWSTKIWNRSAGVHDPIALARSVQLLSYYLHNDRRRDEALQMLASASDLDDNSYWSPVKVLGTGGYAAVGLWAKKDWTGNIVDEMAIKEQLFRREDKAGATGGEDLVLYERGIQEEAVFQLGLQQKYRHTLASEPVQPPAWAVDKENHIVHLRKYKYHDTLDKSRMYLCYAPYGVLWRSEGLYKAFNQSLPEPFLWVLIHSLASAIRVMDGPLQEDAFLYKYRGEPHSPRLRDEHDYMVHGDLKPFNILLDNSPFDDHDLDKLYANQEIPEDLSLIYPRILLSDFDSTKDMNPDYIIDADPEYGTREFQAPEQLNWGIEGDLPNERWTKVTNAHSVWGVGKVLYDAMTGYSPDHLRQNIMETISASDYNEYGQHYLPLEWEGAEEYSKPLRDLVRHCLDPSAALRPTPDQVLQSTATALEYWSDKVATADPAQKRRYGLYFRHGERSDVPVGTKQTLPDASHVERRALFLGIRYDDPEYPVRLPYELWEDIYDDPYMYIFDPCARQMTVNVDGKQDFGDENMVEPYNYGVHLGLVEPQENKDDDDDDEDDMLFHRFDENGVIDRGDDNEDDDQNADQDGEQRGGSGDDLDVSQRHRSPSPEPPENMFEDSDEEEEDTVETLSQLSIAELRGRVRALDIQGVKLSGKGVDKTCLAQALVNHRGGLGPPRAMLKADAKKGKKRG